MAGGGHGATWGCAGASTGTAYPCAVYDGGAGGGDGKFVPRLILRPF